MKLEIIVFVALCVTCTIAQIQDEDSPTDSTESSSDDSEKITTPPSQHNDDETTPNPVHQEESSDTASSTELPTETNEVPTEEPINNEPATEESSNHEPTTEKPVNNEPTTEETSNNEPNTEEPASNEPITEETNSEQSTDGAPIDEVPTSEPSTATFTCSEVGRFPVPENCNKYYFCWDTVTPHATFTCPEAYDPVSKLCSHDYSTCSLAPSQFSSGDVFPYPGDKNTFWESKKHNEKGQTKWELHREKCATGREFQEDYGFCVQSEAESAESIDAEQFGCRRAGKFIDFTSDTKYYECTVKSVSHGVLKLAKRKCKKGDIFDGSKKECVPL